MFLTNSIVVISYTKKYPGVNIQQGISIFNINNYRLVNQCLLATTSSKIVPSTSR